MANTVVVTKILDGHRTAVFHVSLASDGASGDLTDHVLVDPATDFDPALAQKPGMTIEAIWYDLSGFSGRLEYDYLVGDTGVWSMSSDNAAQMDFSCFGGLKDRSNPLDGTGKLMLTTSGFTSSSDAGTIVLKIRKN